jgi:NAD(P)-dependent dehydrogenase (short-subunit alcohol dehydrogenase family)
MGHIAGVDSSYSWVYRASKAALNMAVAAAQPDYPNASFVAHEPGWVQTDMGGAGAPLHVRCQRRLDAAHLPSCAQHRHVPFLDYDGTPFKAGDPPCC